MASDPLQILTERVGGIEAALEDTATVADLRRIERALVALYDKHECDGDDDRLDGAACPICEMHLELNPPEADDAG